MIRRLIPAGEPYHCRVCGEFSEPIYVEIDHGKWELQCSCCGSSHVEHARKCEICGGAYYEMPKGTDNIFGICEDCLSDIDHIIDRATVKLMRGTMLTYNNAREYLADRIMEVQNDTV